LRKRPATKNAADLLMLPQPMLAAERQQALTALLRRREVPPEVPNRSSKPQRMQDTAHLTQPFGEDDALAGALPGLIGIAERP
jgi:hypothetical protein